VQRDDACNCKIGTTVWCKNTVLVEILWRSAKMFALQDVHGCAVQGAVLVKKSCGATRRCLHLQDWHDSAVQGTVAVAKPCGGWRAFGCAACGT